MQHFLRRLTGITVIALMGVLVGSAQTSQPAPTEKKKNYKDQQEYTLYDSATKETDANKKLATLNTWKEKYPDSDFKYERLVLYLNTYQALGQGTKMVDTAKEILALDPKDITALYWITFLAPSGGNTSADAVATATKAANGLLAAEKPATTKDEDWKSAKTNFDAIAYKTLGWAAMTTTPKNFGEAEANYKKSLQADPKSGEVAYSLGQALLAHSIAEKKPEMQSEALYYFARAAAYDGPGALTADGRQKIDAYLTKVYNTLHGDSSGLAELKAMAKANPVPPADFKIKTAAEVAAEQEEELKKTNPTLALWKTLKGQLLSPDGQTYFDSSMKGAAVPKLRGWIIAAKPPVKSKELQLSMEGKDQPANVTLKLVGSDGTTVAPLTGKPDVGVLIEFEGIGDSYTKDPALMVTFDVEKAKIESCSGDPAVCSGPLKEEKVAAPVHHTAKKKS